jgi:hypothetical protein
MMRVEGNLIYGYNLAFLGNLKLGLEHLEKAIVDYDPDQHRSQSYRFGTNPGVSSYTTSALFLWMTGFPDKALQRANDSVALAKRLNHPFSIAYALFHSGLLYLWRQEGELGLGQAQAVVEIAGKYEFHIWTAVGICLQGAALAGMGKAEEGLIQINRGMDLYEELKTPPVFWPLLLLLRAGASGQTGRSDEGLRLLDEAFDIIGESSGNPVSSDLCRLKGELLLLQSPGNQVESESWFRKSLEIAQARKARMLELRAAMCLNRLWREQGKGKQGQQLLKDVYETFTEGFTTADLTESKTLLEDLS